MGNYWLHRISHEHEASYPLFADGWLTLGWSKFADSGILNDARKRDKYCKAFESTYSRISPDVKYKSRWDMWYFALFDKDDIVVVPMFDGKFAICKVLQPACPLSTLLNEDHPEFSDYSWNENEHGKGLYKKSANKAYDLGFAIKVEILGTNIDRSKYADSKLTFRMKMRQTNGNISDLKENVDNALKNWNKKTPIDFLEPVISQSAENLLASINTYLNDNKFEKLIMKYMMRIGSDDVYQPAKNESGKEEYADADVIALFDTLQLMVIIQAKLHSDESDKTAIEQIIQYRKQLQTDPNFHTEEEEYKDCFAWAITSAEFTANAKELAKQNNVRIIEGKDFARMLLKAGLTGIDV